MAILIYYICMYNVISDNVMSRTNETKNCKNKIGRKKTKNGHTVEHCDQGYAL